MAQPGMVPMDFQQRLMQPETGATTEQQAFTKKFCDQAFSTLNAKYNQLLGVVVTFKTVDFDADKGDAVGAFVLRYGKEIVYLPVVMSGGNVTSCEMVYSKEQDTVFPLTDAVVKDILSACMQHESVAPTKVLPVEQTRNMFRTMFRPPVSSNPVMAGSSGVENLPNQAKATIAAYLEANPELLHKIASFSNVEHLAVKLAASVEMPQVVNEIPAVLSVKELTRDLTAKLDPAQKAEALAKGYVIQASPKGYVPRVIDARNLAVDIVTNWALQEVNHASSLYGKGYILRLDYDFGDTQPGLTAEQCLILGPVLFVYGKGFITLDGHRDSVVVAGFTPGVAEKDLVDFGFVPPSELTTNMLAPRTRSFVACAYPSSGGTYKILTPSFYGNHTGESDKLQVRSADDDVSVRLINDHSTTPDWQYTFTPSLTAGYIRTDNAGTADVCCNGPATCGSSYSNTSHVAPPSTVSSAVMPAASLVYLKKVEPVSAIKSINDACRLVQQMGQRIRVRKNGTAGRDIIDSSATKTASYSDIIDVVRHLVKEYGFSKTAVDLALESGDVFVIPDRAADVKKTAAFATTSQVESPGMANSVAPAPAMQQAFNPAILNAAVDTGDEDVLDTGMLASLSGDENIRGHLVDMLPSFIDTTSKLGKTILLFSIYKTHLEDSYGREDYAKVLNANRKVFRSLGDVILDLKRCVNMQ